MARAGRAGQVAVAEPRSEDMMDEKPSFGTGAAVGDEVEFARVPALGNVIVSLGLWR